MSAKACEVVEVALGERIDRMRKLLKRAEQCLSAGDYLQAATRLRLAADEARFDELQLNIFDALSGSE